MEVDVDTLPSSSGLGLRGLIVTLFGLAAVFWPGITLITFVYLFSAFVLINGIMDIIFGFGRAMNANNSIFNRVLTLLFGFLQVGVGVYLVRHPQVSFATLILLIGFTFIVRGIFEIVEGLFDDSPSTNRILLILLGILGGLAGIVVLFQPVASGVAFVWILGIYALISGPMLIAMSFQISKAEKAARALPASASKR